MLKYNMLLASELSWIERLTTNQKVAGSSPAEVTILKVTTSYGSRFFVFNA